MPSPVEQIKERLNIVDVVSSYVKLQKAGKNFKGLSPFNKEKTPSFFVSPDRGVYYCFSSNKGGDIFTFIEEMEGLDFQGALRVLSERAGIPLTYENKESRDARSRLYKILEDATGFFEEELKRNPHVAAYLHQRGLSDEIIRGWRIGYAPDGWGDVKDFLAKKGYTPSEIDRVGLIKKGEEGARQGEYYDRFRNRIMFPIFDSSSRIIAYSGRIFPKKDLTDEAPKYINSPETPLFNKSRVLYGYDKAKGAIRKNNFSILVEGQMDVLLSHQAGFRNTVAISGTALTFDHLAQLKRLSDNMVMAFDADSAGIMSAGRGAAIALPMGINVKVAPLSGGLDPADIISGDMQKWREVIKKSKHVVEFYLDFLAAGEGDRRKLQLRAREIVLPLISKIQNKIDQAFFIAHTASFLGVPEESVREELGRVEADGIAFMPQREFMQGEYKETAAARSRREVIERSLFGIIAWQEDLRNPALDIRSIYNQFASIVGKDYYARLVEKLSGGRDQLAFEAEIIYSGRKDVESGVEELLSNVEEEVLKESYRAAMEKLKAAEEGGRGKDITHMLQVCKELSDKIITLKSRR